MVFHEALQSRGDYTVSGARDAGKGSSMHATMSPRLSALGVPGGWEKLSQDREARLTTCELGAITGISGHWANLRTGQVNGVKKLWSDAGASRWEMVTRNQGQEFVQGRLLPLAQKVAERSVQAVQDVDGEGYC